MFDFQPARKRRPKIRLLLTLLRSNRKDDDFVPHADVRLHSEEIFRAFERQCSASTRTFIV